MANGDDEPDRKGLDELLAMTMNGYLIIYIVLGELPVPIQIPEPGTDWPAAEALPAMNRARELVQDEPIAEVVKRMLGAVLIDWLTCYEMAVVVLNLGEAPWRIDAMEHLLARIAAGLQFVMPRVIAPEDDDGA